MCVGKGCDFSGAVGSNALSEAILSQFPLTLSLTVQVNSRLCRWTARLFKSYGLVVDAPVPSARQKPREQAVAEVLGDLPGDGAAAFTGGDAAR